MDKFNVLKISGTASMDKIEGQQTARNRDGEWYVYTGEDGDAISVAMNGTGPQGGWVGVSLARMALPDKYKTREQVNEFAKMMAAAPVMLKALRNVQKLIAEAEAGGFNWKDGDWIERLFASQKVTSDAIRKATERHK